MSNTTVTTTLPSFTSAPVVDWLAMGDSTAAVKKAALAGEELYYTNKPSDRVAFFTALIGYRLINQLALSGQTGPALEFVARRATQRGPKGKEVEHFRHAFARLLVAGVKTPKGEIVDIANQCLAGMVRVSVDLAAHRKQEKINALVNDKGIQPEDAATLLAEASEKAKAARAHKAALAAGFIPATELVDLETAVQQRTRELQESIDALIIERDQARLESARFRTELLEARGEVKSLKAQVAGFKPATSVPTKATTKATKATTKAA